MLTIASVKPLVLKYQAFLCFGATLTVELDGKVGYSSPVIFFGGMIAVVILVIVFKGEFSRRIGTFVPPDTTFGAFHAECP